MKTIPRHLPIGAQHIAGRGTHFRVWAPNGRAAAVALDGQVGNQLELEREAGGYFSGFAPGIAVGSRYRIRLDGGQSFPDPASRFQPEGPHGPSEVIDPDLFQWTDRGWTGLIRNGQVIYELHLGTFTQEGSWQAAAEQLPGLAALGVTAVEVMPVADFPGRFGWGYDGVCMFAPCRLYGRPDDFRRFVDRAHRLGLGVILDVVYNHLGPDGNYLRAFSSSYFSDRHHTAWGDAINFDGPDSTHVRQFFIANAVYWVTEYHVDGFRFDATHQIFDGSPEHILAEVQRAARAAAAPRSLYLVAESESQDARLARYPECGGLGLDAVWNDDFHHAARVLLTGQREGYYAGYSGQARELVSAFKYGYLFQGQPAPPPARGSPAFDLPPDAFIDYLDNHDQIANSGHGRRCHVDAHPGDFRALTAWLLLSPQTPMFFMGQEFAASTPFLYFVDHHSELADQVRRGRAAYLAEFPRLKASQDVLSDPTDENTFKRCKLDFSERESHAEAYRLHRDLLGIRRNDPTIGETTVQRDASVLGPSALAARFFGSKPAHDRLLLVNFGGDLDLGLISEPLLAPPEGGPWHQEWSSESPVYGGSGTPGVHSEQGWRLPAHSAILFVPGSPSH